MTDIKTIDGIIVNATLKEGWRYTAMDKDRIMVIHSEHQPRLVSLDSIKDGDELPRDTDEVFSYRPRISGS